MQLRKSNDQDLPSYQDILHIVINDEPPSYEDATGIYVDVNEVLDETEEQTRPSPTENSTNRRSIHVLKKGIRKGFKNLKKKLQKSNMDMITAHSATVIYIY